MELESLVKEMAQKAKKASYKLGLVSTQKKNEVLQEMADELEKARERIIEANEKDVENAKQKGLSRAIIDRLILDDKRIRGMCEGLRTVASLPDPIGEVIRTVTRPNGLVIEKVRVPIGVICIIYEARPNVTVDSAGLCFKSGNVTLLRGGKEAFNSNMVLVEIMREVLERNGLEQDFIQILPTTDRSAVPILLGLSEYIDLVIPRGGEGLIKTVVELSHIPVIKHYKGVCHVYVDEDVDLDMALRIVDNAKTQRPAVCNAMETLLVHKNIARGFLPKVKETLGKKGVELRGCPQTCSILEGIKEATEEDWYTEYLDLILSVKVVDSVEGAISHINKYGSMHSDSIATKNELTAKKFLDEVDSACVFWNASTRFSDGGEFGMGAEIGISTDKIHARGPMGLEELTIYKYIVRGNGQIRE